MKTSIVRQTGQNEKWKEDRGGRGWANWVKHKGANGRLLPPASPWLPLARWRTALNCPPSLRPRISG